MQFFLGGEREDELEGSRKTESTRTELEGKLRVNDAKLAGTKDLIRQVVPYLTQNQYRNIELFWLEKTLKIIECNHKHNTPSINIKILGLFLVSSE